MRTFPFPGLARARRPQYSTAQSSLSGTHSCPLPQRTASPTHMERKHTQIRESVSQTCVHVRARKFCRNHDSLDGGTHLALDNHLQRTFSLLFSSFSARKKKQRGRKSPERTLPCPSLLKRLLNMIGAYDQLSLSLPSNVYLPVVRAVVRKMYVCARDDNVRRYSREQIECFLLGTRLPFRFSLPITRARFSLRTRVQHNTKTKSSNDANEEQRSRCTSARGFLYLPLWGCTFHLSVNPPLPPAPCLVLSLGLVPLSLSL